MILGNQLAQNPEDKIILRISSTHSLVGVTAWRHSASNITNLKISEHTGEDGSHKILKSYDLPLIGVSCVDMIITEKCVFRVDKENLSAFKETVS
ncbi:Succinyl-CoA:3-ketoacid coenzyme A transferase subunit B [Orchesella cincta]|uniref:Succinyl-CoA:3-ketoacid coenzyme A transferase subunit B n=1 Tax=Orchesella cincta TaxID=48709 RepID=A0A1D2M5V9_ORCCI|nr:Succinyl-CoA:3-ketoacid coenzyme A transferase subunit B [Orchesella cincta]